MNMESGGMYKWAAASGILCVTLLKFEPAPPGSVPQENHAYSTCKLVWEKLVPFAFLFWELAWF